MDILTFSVYSGTSDSIYYYYILGGARVNVVSLLFKQVRRCGGEPTDALMMAQVEGFGEKCAKNMVCIYIQNDRFINNHILNVLCIKNTNLSNELNFSGAVEIDDGCEGSRMAIEEKLDHFRLSSHRESVVVAEFLNLFVTLAGLQPAEARLGQAVEQVPGDLVLLTSDVDQRLPRNAFQ